MLNPSTLTSQRWRQCSRLTAGRSWTPPGRTLPCWRREASLPRWARAAGSAPPRGLAGPAMGPTGCWDTLLHQHTAHAVERKRCHQKKGTIRKVNDCFSPPVTVDDISTAHVKLYSACESQSAAERIIQIEIKITDALFINCIHAGVEICNWSSHHIAY